MSNDKDTTTPDSTRDDATTEARADAGEARAEDAPGERRSTAKGRSASSMPTPIDTFAAVESAWGFPAFAREFPRHPELDALVTAFARGDYATVRARAPKLAETASDESVKRAAATLRERVEPDRSSKVLFLFAGLLLAFLTAWWVTHDGPEDHAAPAKPPAAPGR